jgi:myotubularin-related protein 6/7/8
MAGSTEHARESRIKNVSLHRRGHQEHGCLYLMPHHLIFSYQPASASSKSSAAREHRRDSSTHQTPSQSRDDSSATNLSSKDLTLQSERNLDKPRTSAQRLRPKEIFIPYPLIHHCLLRPSHAQSVTTKPPGQEPDASTYDDEDDNLFPPTIGTSSSVRPSTDSSRLSISGTPQRSASPAGFHVDTTPTTGSGRSPAIRIRCKDFQMLALHFDSSTSNTTADEAARHAFYTLRDRCCVDRIEEMYAFDFKAPPQEKAASNGPYDARKEFARMGIGAKVVDGPGTAWRITDINHDYIYSYTYPKVLCVPRAVSDNTLKYGALFRSKERIPALAYLHYNGGSISRASQPMVGIKGKRNPQDEKLVQAIFSSHTPPLPLPEDSPVQVPSMASPSTTTLDSATTDLDVDIADLDLGKGGAGRDVKDQEKSAAECPRKTYGSQRSNLIVDARPYVNMAFNKVAGGGIEDVANYAGHDMPTVKVYLDIANIHEMRNSLDAVVKSFGHADYVDLPPNQDMLARSGWLRHIEGVLKGAEKVARVVGLGGSHALIHCSDGWDRTSQVSAMAQLMLDPYYRTLDGYITLVQKDFVSFGHKFRDRNGIEGSEEWFGIENERIQPSRRQHGGSESNNLQALSTKALSNARDWFEKSRGSIFKPQNGMTAPESPSSRPPSPPPNPLIHSPPSAKEKKKQKMKPTEVSPIFHQFLDATFQLLHQAPTVFEFNERFLRRLFYHVYAGQYGEFLFNNERDRSQHPNLPSAWGHFLSRRAEFVNPDYVARTPDPLLFPKHMNKEELVPLRWWSGLFGRKDEEMNVPRASLARQDQPSLFTQASSVSFDESAAAGRLDASTTVRPTKSTPNLALMSDTAPQQPNSNGNSHTPTPPVSRPPLYSKETDNEILAKYAGGSSTSPSAPAAAPRTSTEQFQIVDEQDTDPLGGMTTSSRPLQSGRLDFAAFAQGSAFRDR